MIKYYVFFSKLRSKKHKKLRSMRQVLHSLNWRYLVVESFLVKIK